MGDPKRTRRVAAMTAQLEVVALQLRSICGTSLSAEFALRQQSAEREIVIADALRFGVCDALDQQIGEREQMITRARRPR